MKNKLFLILNVCILPVSNLFGQQVVSSAGAQSKGTNVELSWTIGEPVIETFSNGNTILTQGFHQSNLKVTAIDEISLPETELGVFPNPVPGKLTIGLRKGEIKNLSYSLYSTDGKLILQSVLEKLPGQIDMETVAPGSYLLKITGKNNQLFQTFKIVKTK